MKIRIKVVPNAKKNEIIDQNGTLTVRVTAPPENNLANLAVQKILAKHFNAKVQIVLGKKSKNKVVEIIEKNSN